MFITKKEYMDVSDKFFKLHHGTMVKLTAPNRKNEIYGYILRCEANANDKKLIVFSFVSPAYYSKLVPSFSGKNKTKVIFKSSRENKYYGMLRTLEKWKNIKEENYVNYKDISDNDFIKSIKFDLISLRSLYNTINYNLENLTDDKIDVTCKYILKEFRMIEKYYKDISNLKIVFL